jgi:dynactin-5
MQGPNCHISAIAISSHVYIGANAVLGPFCIIKDNCKILPNTVVPPNMVIPVGSIVGGKPGRIIGEVSEVELPARVGLKEVNYVIWSEASDERT